MYTWYDSWIVGEGFGMNLACELNEVVNIKEA